MAQKSGKIKVGIIGANGYTGYELMRLLAIHPYFEVVAAQSRSLAGNPVFNTYPSLSSAYPALYYTPVDAEDAAKNCDLIFTALPHGLSAETGAKLIELNKKVIDLSADFRYNSLGLFENTYGISHPAPELNGEAIYGLCEINRDKIKSARLIANPGCYTTASILALYPLLKNGLVKTDGIIINAVSGTSGAGRKADESYSLCELANNFKAYSVTNHRHTTEIEEQLSLAANTGISLNFTPHLLPVKRGILATIYAGLNADADKIAKCYDEAYKGEAFIEVLGEGNLPELKDAVMSNMCRIGYAVSQKTNKLIIVSTLDNLIKGASGQAIQNANIMFNFDETSGLPLTGNQL